MNDYDGPPVGSEDYATAYWSSPEGRRRSAEIDAARNPKPAPEPTTDERLAAHEVALARRAEITRHYGRDPGPQPGELSDSDFFDLMQPVNEALMASLEAGSEADISDAAWAEMVRTMGGGE